MSRFIALCAAVMVGSPALAADRPNTLSPKEIADGWLQLFDGETALGWSAQADEGEQKPELAARNGSLHIRGRRGSVQFTTAFQHFELHGEYRAPEGGSQLVVKLHSSTVGLELGDSLRPSGKEWRPLVVRLSAREMLISAGDPKKSSLSGLNFGRSAITTIGFRLPSEEGSFELRNLKLRPLGLQPLFNGKNLDGWRVNAADPKRMASKFAVTEGGELSVKNGPGDLVTDREFDNFVLQFDCKTLGKGLNSGIFFRSIPGQYQNGYEAQIQNLFRNNDRTKPFDFGTGAIYRRVPARRVVSNDNEWFTMTVIASGKHIATWVNGYQTVDWTDPREPNENPRKGYRAAKGRISIQGHDPTTDLLFRKIGVAEIPERKK